MAESITGSSGLFTIQDPQSVTLSSPNSGSYAHNVSMTISWAKTNFTSNVDLYWTTNTTFSTSNNIGINLSGGSFSWDIPATLSSTSIYIWVRKYLDSSVKDRSNSSISITGIVLTKTITDSISISDVPTKTESTWRTYIYKTLADSISISDIPTKTESTWRRYIYKTLTDSVGIADDGWTKTEREWHYEKTLTDSIPITDDGWTKTESIWRSYIYKTLTDSVGITDDGWTKTESTWREYFYKVLTDSVGIADDGWTKEEREWIKFNIVNDTLSLQDDPVKEEREWIKFKTLVDSIVTTDDGWEKFEREWIKFTSLTNSLAIADDGWEKFEREWIKFTTALETLSIQDDPTITERSWIKFAVIGDSISIVDLSTHGHSVQASDSLSISDTWTVSKASPSVGYLLDGGGESLKSKWNTGWISPTDLSRNPILRRVNMDYQSDDTLTVKIFSDDNLTTPVATKTFASSSTSTHGSIRLGTRVKYFLLSIETAQSSNADVKIERIEIEVDD